MLLPAKIHRENLKSRPHFVAPRAIRLFRNCRRGQGLNKSGVVSVSTRPRNLDGGSGGHADKSGGQPARQNPIETNFRAWELHSYSSNDPDLQLATKTRVPILHAPTDVMVRVHAASVNPIDVEMTKGYGQTAINYLRGMESSTRNWTTLPSNLLSSLVGVNERIEFPLILGRDFAGVVTRTGYGVNDLNVGDEVYGVCGIQSSGSHADYLVTSRQMVCKKPNNLSFIEAAAIPYVGLTSWSAVRITGGYHNLNNAKFLILGGSGGVGSFLIQYLKAHGAYVVASCSNDAMELVESLGCDFAIDKDSQYVLQIKQCDSFDCIVDLSGSNKQSELIHALKPGIGQYITLSPPFLSNIDKFGLCGGLVRNFNDIVWENWKSVQSKQVPTKWAFFIPYGRALDIFTSFIEAGRIKPVIHHVFKFENLPAAYQKLSEGHARGKVVVDFQ